MAIVFAMETVTALPNLGLIAVASPLFVKIQLLSVPVRAARRHGLLYQAVLDILCVAVIGEGSDIYV